MSGDPATIATLYHEKFATGIELLSQQMPAITKGIVREESMVGERQFFDQVGKVKLQPKVGTAVDIQRTPVTTGRRSVTALTNDGREFLDEVDRLTVLNDPRNAYTEAFVAAGNRFRDKTVIDAMLGNAFTGKAGATSVALPAGQKIADGGTGFTYAKLRQAVRMLKQANALRQEDRIHCLWGSRQEEALIDANEVKSFDFNNRKVLVEGELNQFYSVNFHRIEDDEDNAAGRILPKSGTVRSCIIWIERLVLAATRIPVKGEVDWLPERKSWQVYGVASLGATRMEEVGVVQLDVQEP